MVLLSIVLGVALILLLWLKKLNKDYYVMAFFTKRPRTVNGQPLDEVAPSPQPRTIFGNTFDMLGFKSGQIFDFFRNNARVLKKSYLLYTLGMLQYNIITPEDLELVLNDPNILKKGILYRFVVDFLGDGLLSTTDKKWHQRRKMLTPAFHFNILPLFEEIFKEESKKFTDRYITANSTDVPLTKIIPTFTLNTVCETALGVKLDERLDANEYRESFDMIEVFFVKRASNALYFIDRVFKLFEGKEYMKHVGVVHRFSSGIIEKRRTLFKAEQESAKIKQEIDDAVNDDFIPKKKRYAMLDTLLKAEQDGLINHAGICEEVDTFMFEGFDTTSMALIFIIMNMASYQHLQNECYEEINEIVPEDLENLEISHLNALVRLDCFIKETLRLMPSVPSVQRETVGETKLGNLILPHGTQLVLHLYDVMHDPRHYPKPFTFDPDRFLPENTVGRSPFAFVPFSAGQRNCIGQKFAMLEMKTLMVYIIRSFTIVPTEKTKLSDVKFGMGLITRTVDEVYVRFVKRIKE